MSHMARQNRSIYDTRNTDKKEKSLATAVVTRLLAFLYFSWYRIRDAYIFFWFQLLQALNRDSWNTTNLRYVFSYINMQ
nr:MAG TPA: hypothetical protein [Caudoviricetes sp.]